MHTLNNFRKAIFSLNTEKRYAARYQILANLARLQGLRLYNRNLKWIDDFDELTQAWQGASGLKADVKDRHFNLYSMAKSVASLPGDTAECGAYLGASSFIICMAGNGVPGRLHHIFDSFEGLSAPTPLDKPLDNRAYEWHHYDLAIPLETVQRNLRQFDSVRYYQGWIPERFQEVADHQFAFVHVDVDLYQPTFDSIAFFYERLVPGGILLCDDYGFTTCPGATKAFDDFIADKPEKHVIHLTSGQGFIVKR